MVVLHIQSSNQSKYWIGKIAVEVKNKRCNCVFWVVNSCVIEFKSYPIKDNSFLDL